MTLRELRDQLCQGTNKFCNMCFKGTPYERMQNPPNVFRIPKPTVSLPIVFIFDKPNDNTELKNSALVPITIYDDRAGVDYRLPRAQSHLTLITLCKMLGLISDNSSSLYSDHFYITNAVKCDMCSATGKTGRVKINEKQASKCRETYLFKELEAVNARALVFFGTNAQEFVLGKSTPLWSVNKQLLNGKEYWVLRVPHTSPTAFNTHGGKGQKYLGPFAEIERKANVK